MKEHEAFVDKMLANLKMRLMAHPGFHARGTCKVEFFVKQGGLAGDVVVTHHLPPQPHTAHKAGEIAG